MLSLANLRRSSRPLPPELAEELQQLKLRLGLRRRLDGRVTSRRSIPMTWGYLRPVVLLPSEMAQWPRERRQMVLLHELAHIKRCDFGVQLLGQISRAVHWFNPLAWRALGRLRVEQERACDDFVINAGECAADYAMQLMAVTARSSKAKWAQAVALAFHRRAGLAQRLQAILDTSRDRRPLSTHRHLAIVGTLVVAVGLVATPRWPAGQAQAQPAADAVNLPGEVQQNSDSIKPNAEPKPPADAQGETLSNVRELIQNLTPEELDSKRLNEAAIRGMLEALKDPHSQLLSGDASREMAIQLQGHIVGIGAQLAKEQDAIIIVTPLPDSPAAKSGLKPRDRIVAVDGHVLSDLGEVVQAIRGPQGSSVTLRIGRGTDEIDVVVTRDAVQLAPVRGLWLDANGQWRYWLDVNAKIEYLQITEFSQRTAVELELALARLHDQGIKGLVLDLRGCPGGLLDESVKVASMLIKQGTVATVRSRQSSEKTLKVDGTAKYADIPLIVLVDDLTASAGEVLAAAVQDRQRGIVVGQRTWGKGTVQSLVPVSELDVNLKITTAQIYRANGAPLDATIGAKVWGVDPNDGYFVPLSDERRSAFHERKVRRDTMGALDLPETVTPELIVSELADPVLAAALKSMSAKLKAGNFAATGRPLSEMVPPPANRKALERERDALRAKLEQIEKQLGTTTSGRNASEQP
jgi:carboxyl-terminal processing protease